MGYVPYTGTKDYFEEPNTGNDLVLRFTNNGTSFGITAIEESDLGRLGLVPPSSKIGAPYGKVLDIVKLHIPAGRASGDTIQLFTNPNSGFADAFYTGIYPFIGKAFANAGQSSKFPAAGFAGKVLRVDYIPLSDGSAAASAIITLLLYV